MNRLAQLMTVLVAAATLSMPATAAEAGYPLLHMEPDLHDKASLQRGAQTYMNYCLGCHALKYQRYERTADDLGVPHDLMLQHLVFDPDKQIGSPIDNTISEDHARAWFGAVPPDLTLYTSLKGGPDYLYTYLKTFYEDPDRPLGVNNLVFENVGMPHALLELQGVQRKVCKEIPRLAANGGEMRDPLTSVPITEEVCGNELIARGVSPLEHVDGTGSLTAEEYDQVVYDLSNFLYYVADPSRLERERLGVYVLLFLAFFFVFTYLLGREYTREFH
ncbi:MAG: cytochrome c1 [Proteobacteria bacterium]|jgi:cytochrome c1|nr:cytochrome c1 [Pseudomonadota bacterium]MDA1299106.1 cytochrome c1 [Pseudomonadota bacterium]